MITSEPLDMVAFLEQVFPGQEVRPSASFKIDFVPGFLLATLVREDGTIVHTFKAIDPYWNIIKSFNPATLTKPHRAELILALNRLGVVQTRICTIVGMSQSSVSNIIRNRGLNSSK